MQKNIINLKLLVHSVLFGFVFFLLGIFLDSSGKAIDNSPLKIVFSLFLILGPGLIYSFLVINYYREKTIKDKNRIIFSISNTFIYIALCIFSMLFSDSPLFTNSVFGALGALLFLTLTKILINSNLRIASIFIGTIVGYFAFLSIMKTDFLKIGTSIALWWVGIALIITINDYISNKTK